MSNTLAVVPTQDVTASNSLTDFAARIRNEHIAVGVALKHSVEHAMAAGDLLMEAQAQLKHGQWLPWLKSCGISQRTAQRYMRLARNRSLIEANATPVSDLGVSGALALLSVPRRDSEMTTLFEKLVDRAADASFDFFELDELEHLATERLSQHELLVKASATVEGIGELLSACTSERAEKIAAETKEFSERIVAISGEFRAAGLDEMGLADAEFDQLEATIKNLKAQGKSAYEIAWRLAHNPLVVDRERRPLADPTTITRLASQACDVANEWLSRVEQLVADASDPVDLPAGRAAS
jgi:hypothetical protein